MRETGQGNGYEARVVGRRWVTFKQPNDFALNRNGHRRAEIVRTQTLTIHLTYESFGPD